MNTSIDIYTDGACSKNPGPGGWAFVILKNTGGVKSTPQELTRHSGGTSMTTNNRMELSAVLEALKRYVEMNIVSDSLRVYTDSKYVQQGISVWIKKWRINGWRTADRQPVKNQDLWQELDLLTTQCSPQWQWVRGHAGNSMNELCDRLAVAEIKKL